MSTYRIFYGTLAGPLILIGLGLHFGLRLNLTQFAAVMAAALILLLNIYFYVLRKKKETIGVSIWIDLGEIQLLKKGIVLYKDSLKNLRVIQPEKQIQSKNTPTTMLIEGNQFPRMVIRSAQSVKNWYQTEQIDFCVTSEKEWIHLLQALAACERFE